MKQCKKCDKKSHPMYLIQIDEREEYHFPLCQKCADETDGATEHDFVGWCVEHCGFKYKPTPQHKLKGYNII